MIFSLALIANTALAQKVQERSIPANNQILYAPSGSVQLLEFNQVPKSLNPSSAVLRAGVTLHENFSVNFTQADWWTVNLSSVVNVRGVLFSKEWAAQGLAEDVLGIVSYVPVEIPLDPASIVGRGTFTIPVSSITEATITEGFQLTRTQSAFSVEHAEVIFRRR